MLMIANLGTMMTYLRRPLPIKSHDHIFTWFSEITWHTEIIISPLPQCLWPQNKMVTNFEGLLPIILLDPLVTWVVYNIGVLKHLTHWVHVLVCRYWNILPPGVMKHSEPKIYNDFELYQVCMLNWFKYFDQKNQTRKFIHNFLSQNVSMPPYCILSTHAFTTPQ